MPGKKSFSEYRMRPNVNAQISPPNNKRAQNVKRQGQLLMPQAWVIKLKIWVTESKSSLPLKI